MLFVRKLRYLPLLQFLYTLLLSGFFFTGRDWAASTLHLVDGRRTAIKFSFFFSYGKTSNKVGVCTCTYRRMSENYLIVS